MRMCFLQKQVQCFRQASSFSSRRCLCCFSGLWLTFTGLTTERRWLWACTHTSTHYSHTSYSSAGSMPCWSRRRLSLFRTSSQLWDSKAKPKAQTHTCMLTFLHIYIVVISGYKIILCNSPLWAKLPSQYGCFYIGLKVVK